MNKIFAVAAAALLAAVPASAMAAELIVVDGKLTGATGVDVGGSLYDVTFVDTTCAAIFGGCDSTSDFPFTTQASATVAGQALLDQVFLDVLAGNFDSDGALTFGCSFFNCQVQIPFQVTSNPTNIYSIMAYNSSGSNDQVVPVVGLTANYNEATNTAEVYALFTPVLSPSAVPEPRTWAMMLFGFGAIGVAMRRRRSLKLAQLS